MTKSEIVTLLVLVIAYQAYATVLVRRSDHFDDTQKQRMVIFIWLIPIIGAALVRIRLNGAEHAAKTPERAATEQDEAAKRPSKND